MKFNKFNLKNNDGNSNCVVRSFCKVFNLTYDEVYNELCYIQKSINAESYNDVEVFENFMKKRNVELVQYGKELKIKDLELEDGAFIVLCWDKNKYYHMIPIIDNIIYDKNDKCMELYAINIYRF